MGLKVGVVAVVCTAAWGQTSETIRSGRPGQSIGPYTVGDGIVQAQLGLDHSTSRNQVFSTADSTLNTVVRWGVGERFEWSALINGSQVTGGPIAADSNEDQVGVSQFHLGFRSNIIDKPDGWVPGFGVQLRMKTTAVASDFRAVNAAPVALMAFQHKLGENLSLIHNIGARWDGATAVPQYLYISNLSLSLNEAWGSFIEVYGDEKGGVDRLFADFGASYLANKDLQWDISAGGGKNQGVEDYFISIGISWRYLPSRNPSEI